VYQTPINFITSINLTQYHWYSYSHHAMQVPDEEDSLTFPLVPCLDPAFPSCKQFTYSHIHLLSLFADVTSFSLSWIVRHSINHEILTFFLSFFLCFHFVYFLICVVSFSSFLISAPLIWALSGLARRCAKA
jgi:hypothetical protein